MQSMHGLFNGRVVVESMALKDIDVIELKSFERVIDRRDDALRHPQSVSTRKGRVRRSFRSPFD